MREELKEILEYIIYFSICQLVAFISSLKGGVFCFFIVIFGKYTYKIKREKLTRLKTVEKTDYLDFVQSAVILHGTMKIETRTLGDNNNTCEVVQNLYKDQVIAQATYIKPRYHNGQGIPGMKVTVVFQIAEMYNA